MPGNAPTAAEIAATTKPSATPAAAGAPAATPSPWRAWFAPAPLFSAVNCALTGLGLVLGAVTLPHHGWLWWFMGVLFGVTLLAWWSAARSAAEADGQAARLKALHETLGGLAVNLDEIKGAHPALAAALERANRLAEPVGAPALGAGAAGPRQRAENRAIRQRKKAMKKAARGGQKGRPGKKGA